MSKVTMIYQIRHVLRAYLHDACGGTIKPTDDTWHAVHPYSNEPPKGDYIMDFDWISTMASTPWRDYYKTFAVLNWLYIWLTK